MEENASRNVRNGVVAVAVAVGLAMTGAWAVGASPDAVDKAVSKQSAARPWNFNQQESQRASETGVAIRDQIVKARDGIDATFAEGASEPADVTQVAQGLVEARGQLEEILDASPAVRIKAQIYTVAMGIPAEDEGVVTQSLGAIQGELATLPDWPSVERTRDLVTAAQDQFEQGDKQAAFESLKAADGAVVPGSGDIPAAEAYYLVNVALAALSQQDAEVAGQALEAAQQSADAFVAAVTRTAPANPGTTQG